MTPATLPGTDVTLAPGDFERVRELIYRRAGITLAPTKRSMVYSRLSRRLRDTGHTDVGAYLDAGQGPIPPSGSRS
jgi:chemotaxis protein methyltransferase CheR